MKKLALLTLALGVSSLASAQLTLPFTEDFESGSPNAAWDTNTQSNFNNGWERTGNSTLSAVSSDVDWRGTTINPPPSGGSFFGKLEFGATGFETVWRMLGDGTNTDYQVSVDIYVPLINDADQPDDFLYHGVYAYPVAPSVTGVRVHSHLNEAGGSVPAPRFRVESTAFNPTPAEGWTTWVLKFDHTNQTTELDVTGAVSFSTGALSTPDLPTTGSGVGIGMFVDGDTVAAANGINGPRDLYFDNFVVTPLGSTDVDDWMVY